MIKLSFGPVADKSMKVKSEIFAEAKVIVDDMIKNAKTYEDLDVDKLADRFHDFSKNTSKETLEWFVTNVLSSYFANHVSNAIENNMALDAYMNQSDDSGGTNQ